MLNFESCSTCEMLDLKGFMTTIVKALNCKNLLSLALFLDKILLNKLQFNGEHRQDDEDTKF